VIEYPNAADSYYHVRVYEVPAGQLGAYTVVDKGGPGEIMTGVRLSGVFSPDGQWLYSLYARENQGAFVHALNLSSPYAFCLDLPGSGWSSSSSVFHWSLAITPPRSTRPRQPRSRWYRTWRPKRWARMARW
jgi:hypothetical protein